MVKNCSLRVSASTSIKSTGTERTERINAATSGKLCGARRPFFTTAATRERLGDSAQRGVPWAIVSSRNEIKRDQLGPRNSNPRGKNEIKERKEFQTPNERRTISRITNYQSWKAHLLSALEQFFNSSQRIAWSQKSEIHFQMVTTRPTTLSCHNTLYIMKAME